MYGRLLIYSNNRDIVYCDCPVMYSKFGAHLYTESNIIPPMYRRTKQFENPWTCITSVTNAHCKNTLIWGYNKIPQGPRPVKKPQVAQPLDYTKIKNFLKFPFYFTLVTSW